MCAQHLTARLRPAAPDVLEKVMENVRAVDEETRAAGAWVFTGGCTSRASRPCSILADGPYAEVAFLLEPNRASNTTPL
jgi:hypothetical protein